MLIIANLLALAAPQQHVDRPCPLRLSAQDLGTEELRLQLDEELHETLRANRRVTLTDFPMPDGGFVSLELEQRSWRGVLGAPVVDGARRDEIFLEHDLSVWRGSIAGEPESQVYLGFSRHGSHGFLKRPGELTFLQGRPSPEGDWSLGHAAILAVPNATGLLPLGSESESCGTEPAPPRERSGPLQTQSMAGIQHLREAVSVDYWCSVAFGGNVDAEVAYIYQLLWSVSEFYLAELGSVFLTYPYVEFWTTPSDPWDEPDKAIDNKGDVLDEFYDAWVSVFEQKDVHLALLLCGNTIGGGKASGAGISAEICPALFATLGEHAVVGSAVNLNMPFPVTQGPQSWPFFVIAHEIGHNMGATHTHENGIDDCDDEDPADCPEGTIMSYCHMCNSLGIANLELAFHPETKADLWDSLDDDDCLPVLTSGPIYVGEPLVPWPGNPYGTSIAPYPDIFEGLQVALLLGDNPAVVRIRGSQPNGYGGNHLLPALVFGQLLSSGQTVRLEGWDTGGSLGD